MEFKFYKGKNPFERNSDDMEDNKKKRKRNRFSGKAALVIILLILGFSLFSNAFYTVNQSDYAVVTTFGKPNMVSEPGIHVKIPFVQQVYIVSKNIKGVAIGFDDNTMESVETESLMITLDYNFINADFYIEYQVTDPIKNLYRSQDPVVILENLAQSYIRDTVGLYKVDDVLTTGKYEIQAIIKEKLINRIDREDLGIQVVNVTIQDAEPPTVEVANAFKDVETAKQGKETAINNANKYKNEKIPNANAQIDQILKTAEANKQARINEAKGQVARFESLYEEYSKFPLITKKRMFYEAMEKIIPDMKVIIDSGTGVQTMLPLESFTEFPEPTPETAESQSN